MNRESLHYLPTEHKETIFPHATLQNNKRKEVKMQPHEIKISFKGDSQLDGQITFYCNCEKPIILGIFKIGTIQIEEIELIIKKFQHISYANK